jgi:hypothetical protein
VLVQGWGGAAGIPRAFELCLMRPLMHTALLCTVGCRYVAPDEPGKGIYWFRK